MFICIVCIYLERLLLYMNISASAIFEVCAGIFSRTSLLPERLHSTEHFLRLPFLKCELDFYLEWLERLFF